MATLAKGALSSHVASQTVAILGGGITGLSAAYYIQRKYGPSVKPVIFESRSTTGGWIRSFQHETNTYEVGPRTIRPVGVSGLNTLDLLSDLGLDRVVNYVPSDHPAAKNRLIYLNGKLVRLPMETSILWKTTPPFQQPLIKTLIKELFTSKKVAPDDSLHSFIARRFGQHMADTMVDPLIRGICAGDAREISVKFLIPGLYELEQKHGSVVLGNLLARFEKEAPNPFISILGDAAFASIGSSNLARTARDENWSVWTLDGGLEQLPQKIHEKLTTPGSDGGSGVEILTEATVKSVNFFKNDRQENAIKIDYKDHKTNQQKSLDCAHVISALPGWSLGQILGQSEAEKNSEGHSSSLQELSQILKAVQARDVTVTNFKFSQDHSFQAFGFLVPSTQKDLEGLLGVVFNSCAFPQHGDTIITSMSQGISPATVDKHIVRILGLEKPHFKDVQELKQCIPQYTVGHYERIIKARELIEEGKLPLTLAGSSYDGVSVNDCIMSGRKAAELLELPKANENSYKITATEKPRKFEKTRKTAAAKV